MLRQNIRISFRQNDLVFQILAGCSLGLILGIASIWFSPLLVLGALAAVVLFVGVIFKRPEIGLLGYLIVTSTIINGNLLPRITIGVGRILITDIILLAMIGIILIRLLLESNFRIIHTPLDLPIIAFLGIGLLTTMLSIGQSSLTVSDSLGPLRTVFSYLIFFVVTNLVREEQQLRTLLRGLLLLAAVVAFAMIAQFLLGNYVRILPGRIETLGTEGISFMGVTRIIPPGESLIFPTFLAITVGLLIDKLNHKNIWAILVWGLTGLGVVLTFKRNLWITVILALFLVGVVSWWRVRLRLAKGFLLAISITAIMLYPVLNQPESRMYKLVTGTFERLVSVTNPQTYKDPNSSLRWRDFEYQYARPQIFAHPLIGLGLGAIYRPFVAAKDWKGFDGRRYIHNGHLSIMVHSGLLGYFSFLVFSLLALGRGFVFWKRIRNKQLQSVLLGLTLAYLGILIGSIVSPMIVTSWWTPVIGLMLGINEVIIAKEAVRDTELCKE